MSEKSNNADLSPKEDQGPVEPSRPLAPPTETPLHDSRNKAEKLVSIKLKITGPLKSKITNRVRIANASISAMIELNERTVKDQGSADETQDRTAVHKAQQDLYFLEVLPALISRTMEMPDVAQHEDYLQLQEEVTERYRERQAADVSQKLSEAIQAVTATLLEVGIVIPDYVPTTDDIRKANGPAHEEQEYMVMDNPVSTSRAPTAPPSGSSGSFRGSGISSMIYDESQMNTLTAIHNNHAQILIDELVREKAEAAERDRARQQEILQLTERVAQLSELNVQRNSLYNELNKTDPTQQKVMANARTRLESAAEAPILTQTNNRTTATAPRPPVEQATSTPVNAAAAVISSRQPDLSSEHYTAIMNAINNIQARIDNDQRPYAGGNETNSGRRENTRDSQPDIRIPSRNQLRPPSRQSKIVYSEDSDLESSLFSDDEQARVVYSGSGDNYGHRRHSRHQSETARDQTRTSNEPKLATVLSLLPKFDGSGDWEEFRDTFQADVLSRNDIRPNQMHKILSDHLIGKAKDCVVNSKDHKAAIEATFRSLERAFGKTHSKQKLLKKLNQLSFHQTDTEQMRQDMAKIENLITLILEKGVRNTDDRITKVVTSKLPLTLQKPILDKWKDDRTTIKQVIDKASEKIQLLELEQEMVDLRTATSVNEIPSDASINFTNGRSVGDKNKTTNPVYDASKVKEKFFDHMTKTYLPGYYAPGNGLNLSLIPTTFPFDSTEPSNCRVCSTTGHSALRCKLNSAEFRSTVERKKLCAICLSTQHAITDCRSHKACIYCGGTHHTGGCPLKEFYRDMANYPQGAKPRQTLFRERSKNNNSK